MEFKISQELAQVTLNYLAKQPYEQVFQLVEALRNLKPIEVKPEIPVATPE